MSDPHAQLRWELEHERGRQRIRVLVVDAQSVVRAGLRVLLQASDEVEVVGEAGSADQALLACERLQPDVVLREVRLSTGDGIAALSRVAATAGPTPRVLVLSNVAVPECVHDCLRGGASGFLLKHSSPERILDGIRTVPQGGMPIDPALTRRVVGIYPRLSSGSDADNRSAIAVLSLREGQIVALLARGLNTSEVACRLTLSTTTVKTHISHILGKWGVRDRVQLVARAYEIGFVQQFHDSEGRA